VWDAKAYAWIVGIYTTYHGVFVLGTGFQFAISSGSAYQHLHLLTSIRHEQHIHIMAVAHSFIQSFMHAAYAQRNSTSVTWHRPTQVSFYLYSTYRINVIKIQSDLFDPLQYSAPCDSKMSDEAPAL
jgi:hypothetical protein